MSPGQVKSSGSEKKKDVAPQKNLHATKKNLCFPKEKLLLPTKKKLPLVRSLISICVDAHSVLCLEVLLETLSSSSN